MQLSRLVVALACLGACTGQGREAYLEFPSAFATRYSAAGSTDLRFGIGLGFTHFPLEFFSFRLGYGVSTTYLPSFSQGTQNVYASGFEQEIEARGFLAYGFDGSVIAFWPYVFIGPHSSLSATKLVAYDSSERVFRANFGFRGGAGIQIRFGDVALKFDSSAGFGSSGLNLRTTIMLGFGIF